jgi:isopentenyldiphosphate isomerase
MAEEIYNIFDENFERVGEATSSKAHAKGLWHETFHCWLFRIADDGTTKVMFQLRGPNKSLFPSRIDITAAGHIHSFETPIEGRREVEEELRIRAEADNFIYLGVRPDMAKVGDIVNREFCHTYLLKTEKTITEVDFDTSEVYGLVEIDLVDGIQLFSGRVQSVVADAVYFDAKTGSKDQCERPIAISDLVPRVDRYYMKVFLNIQKYIEDGKSQLAI